MSEGGDSVLFSAGVPPSPVGAIFFTQPNDRNKSAATAKAAANAESFIFMPP
jgi:hypothetical protein